MKTYILTRDDLMKGKKDSKSELINAYDFKISSITITETHEADLIVFVDSLERKTIVMKTRY